MVHGLRTIDALNEAAEKRRCSPAFEVPAMQAVADVRFVIDVNFNEAVYIDGKLRDSEVADGVVSIGNLADLLNGRACVIANVSLSDDFPPDINWPKSFDELIPYIETES